MSICASASRPGSSSHRRTIRQESRHDVPDRGNEQVYHERGSHDWRVDQRDSAMKGDFSRSTYRPSNHYSSVRLQQGRVLLDAEWNEQADLTEHLDRTTTNDVVGRTGAPKSDDPAVQNFLVTVDSNGTDLLIAPGRIYVDGILCENDDPAGVLYTQQPDLAGAAVPDADGNYAVYLDVW